MSTAKVEFHFDFGSPNAYLSHLVIPEIARRQGVKFNYVPVLLGGVFKLTNNRSPAETLSGIKNKPEYQRIETERFLRRHHHSERAAAEDSADIECWTHHAIQVEVG